MLTWTGLQAEASYRGFTHLQSNYRGITHRSGAAAGQLRGHTGWQEAGCLWISDIPGSFWVANGRGFTHLGFGVSHTPLSGDHTPNHGVSPTKGPLKML